MTPAGRPAPGPLDAPAGEAAQLGVKAQPAESSAEVRARAFGDPDAVSFGLMFLATLIGSAMTIMKQRTPN